MAHSTISPGENRVDLHAHSTASDGTLSPTEIVQLARDSNLRAVALTDHDTVAGVPEALEAGKRLGVEVLRASRSPPTTRTPAPTFWATWWTRPPPPSRK